MTRARRLQLLERHEARLRRLLEWRQRVSNRYTWARIVTFFGGLAVSLTIFFTVGAWLFWVALFAAVLLFGLVVVLHQRVEESLQRFTQLHRFTRRQIASATVNWDELPLARLNDPRYEHPFEADLDLVGDRSLHRLIDTAASLRGSERLRSWLTETRPDLSASSHRQQLVKELLPLTLLRHKLAVDGQFLVENDAGWEETRLLAWLEQSHSTSRMGLWLAVLSANALLNIALFVASQVAGLPAYWHYTLALYALLYLLRSRTISGAFAEAARMRDDLQRLLGLFRHLERFPFARSPALKQLCIPLQREEIRPTHALRGIGRIVAATGLQGNPFVALALNAVAPWGLFFAWRLEAHKEQLAAHLPLWLESWHELEALSSLANAAYLNPDYTFPALRSAVDAPVYAVEKLGHPLLPATTKVRNDFTFSRLGEVVILTGSNMAGKSTFLKALGLSLALAVAGGAVDAIRMEMTLFRLFTCIKVSDSVTSGISYFYAEVRRLKALLDALETEHQLPLFFAIDEIFRGTNNRERLLGSQAYIERLVGQRGVGLIATHDLELVKLAERSPQTTNYHFRDEIAAGQMHFDYRLRPGPSPTTNALKIMRSAGLPAPDGQVED
jgi:ABC-type multidrug transport system fused ATPase/permease subunit